MRCARCARWKPIPTKRGQERLGICPRDGFLWRASACCVHWEEKRCEP